MLRETEEVQEEFGRRKKFGMYVCRQLFVWKKEKGKVLQPVYRLLGSCDGIKFLYQIKFIKTYLMWQGSQQAGQKINFDDLFSQENLTVLDLLDTDQIVQESRRQNEKITEKLFKERNILRQLIDIALRPKQLEAIYNNEITREHTHKSIQILNSLELSEYLFKPSPKEDDEVIQEQETQNDLLEYLFKVLKQKKPIQETPLSYLVKLMIPLCYNRPKQIVQHFQHNPSTLTNLFEHFYSNSLLDWFMRLLQVEDSSSFFEKEKIEFLLKFSNQLSKEEDAELLADKLDNYKSVFENTLEKLDDRFDKGKYSSMIKQVLIEKSPLECLFTIVQSKQNEEVLVKVLNIFQVYLKFSVNNRSLNVSTSKMSDGASDSSIYEIRLNSELIYKIKTLVKDKIQIISTIYKANCVISYLRLVKILNIVDNQYVTTILTPQFVNNCLNLMAKLQNNNILHNIIKEIILDAINKSPTTKYICQILLNEEKCSFMTLLGNLQEKNSKKFYQIQIYNIYQGILKKSEEEEQVNQKIKSNNLSNINLVVKEKQTFYAKQIGGNPRKESSCWDSSQEMIIDSFFPKQSKIVNLSSEKEDKDQEIIAGGNEHWFDYELPLYSDDSKDESSGGNFDKSYEFIKNELILKNSQGQSGDKPNAAVQKELEGSFNKHFDSYLSFSIDEILDEYEK